MTTRFFESCSNAALVLAIAALAAYFDPVPPFSYYAAAVLVAIAGLHVGITFWALRKHKEKCQNTEREAAAMKWVRSGASEAEVQSRYAAAAAAGLFASSTTAASAFEGPLMNVDGTPMLPGFTVDMNGNIFGVSAETGDFAEITADASLINLADAYSSPFGSKDSFSP